MYNNYKHITCTRNFAIYILYFIEYELSRSRSTIVIIIMSKLKVGGT